MARSILRNFDAKFSNSKHGSKIFEYDQIKDMLQDYYVKASNLVEICKDAYWEVGMWLAYEAARRTPRDTGTMESAIYCQEISGRSIQKFSLILSYDPGIRYPTSKYKDGRTTGEVFEAIHEGIIPASGAKKKLGKRSQAKQASNPDVVVGGMFMSRAIEENAEEIRNKIMEAVRRGIAEHGLQKKKYRYISKRGKMYRVGVDDDF